MHELYSAIPDPDVLPALLGVGRFDVRRSTPLARRTTCGSESDQRHPRPWSDPELLAAANSRQDHRHGVPAAVVSRQPSSTGFEPCRTCPCLSRWTCTHGSGSGRRPSN